MKRARSVVTSDDNLSAYLETLRVSGKFSLSPVRAIHVAGSRGSKLLYNNCLVDSTRL